MVFLKCPVLVNSNANSITDDLGIVSVQSMIFGRFFGSLILHGFHDVVYDPSYHITSRQSSLMPRHDAIAGS